MRKSRLEKTQAVLDSKRVEPVETSLTGLVAKLVGGKPLPTQLEYIFSPERIKWYCGPLGCAKTSTLCASVIVPALMYPGSKWLVARSTWWTLEQSTLQRFMECLRRLGPNVIVERIKGPPMRIWLASAVAGGEPSEIVFHGLDDLQKLGSIEFNGIAVDEVNELEESLVMTLNTRLRLKRPDQDRAEGPFFLNLASNPVRRSHWLHKQFCGESDCEVVPYGKKYKPHPDENEANLPPNYYEDLAKKLSPEMKIRFIEGECGPDPAGQAVFPEFRHSLHVSNLEYIPGRGMIRGWDFGRRRPACVWAQTTPEGHTNRLWCELGDNELLESFAARMIQISNVRFPMANGWNDFVDPHGTQRRDVCDVTSLDILQRLGLRPKYRDVNIEAGLGFMSKGLCTLVRGRPVAMYDRVGCALLIEGYAGGYTYQTPTQGHRLKEKPLADGFYEHLMDADRYIGVNLNIGSTVPLDKHKASLRVIRNRETGY